MLRSKYCILNSRIDRDLTKVGECVFDQGFLYIYIYIYIFFKKKLFLGLFFFMHYI
jgi:hypothetical protein